MHRRSLLIGLAATAVAASLAGSAGAASAAQTANARIVLAPNHHVSAKPGGGGHGGGGGTVWPGWSSSNWSGYAVTRDAPYTSASAAWTVPTVAPSRGSTYSAAWVGVGGFNDSTLIQTGTEQDFINGKAVYAAWWTTDAQGYAETSFAQQITVHGGDRITASVARGSNGHWTITLADQTSGQTGTQSLTNYANAELSAEWIMEAPGIGGRTAPLAHYGTDVFDPGTVNGNASPGFTDADGGVLVQKSAVVSIPSKPDSELDGFDIAYGSTQPAVPVS